ncbi:hypothetical protein A2U01_0107138, partial [Trifolium medium]|nr:hypothetical protein [Trifolium medium]
MRTKGKGKTVGNPMVTRARRVVKLAKEEGRVEDFVTSVG